MSVRQIPWAAQSWAALAMHGAVVAALVAAAGGNLSAQETPADRPAARRLSDMLPQSEPSLYYDESVDAPKRYDEPPPPPFDFWQPTWMPCQSLRTNRSLVMGHLYFGMDMMGWATKGVHAPALATSSPAGTSAGQAGVLGQSGTTVLFGDEFIQNEMRPGGKLTIGWWFDPNQYSGIEWHYFELDGAHIRFDSPSQGIVARPFVDANTGTESNLLVNFPPGISGSIHASSDLQLTSTGIIYRNLFYSNQFSRFDYLVGYRHTHLDDEFRISQTLTPLGGTTGTRSDLFRAVNQFDGADFGLKGWWSKNGTLALTGLAKIAIGATNNDVVIQGSSTTPTPNQGVLALTSNSGHFNQQQFGIVSEIGLGLEWQPGCFWKFNLGYTWFYWSEVGRALSQVDRTLDFTQVTAGNSATRPAFDLNTTSFWAQGINGGFTYQF